MWLVISLFADRSTLDDIGVVPFEDRADAAAHLQNEAIKSYLKSGMADDDDEELGFRRQLTELILGKDIRIEHGSNSWELRQISLTTDS